MKYFSFIVLLITITAAASQQYVASQSTTEFVEPLKNISAAIGTNVEFTCSVRHLGSNRIMWLRKRGSGPEELLAVNTLFLSRNPKMSVSVLPTSGLVTDSILYIYNVGDDEAGIYSCSVNSDPMIIQKGILDIFSKAVLPPRTEPTTTTTPPVIIRNSADSGSNSKESLIFCFDLPKMWRDTKRDAGDLANNIWNKISGLFRK